MIGFGRCKDQSCKNGKIIKFSVLAAFEYLCRMILIVSGLVFELLFPFPKQIDLWLIEVGMGAWAGNSLSLSQDLDLAVESF